MFEIVLLSVVAIVVFMVVSTAIVIIKLRRVVPTNMVHIVQSRSHTTPYGRGKPAGNTYYQWPSWLPVIGITVTHFPESIFQIQLESYQAYDSARLPFMVDVTAFFRVDSAETAAQRVATFSELSQQLRSVLQGSVRRILATNALEDIMQERASLGQKFTDEVRDNISEWGVLPVKTIEFMDIRDAEDSNVISNIMAKEMSRIDRESRVSVAANKREAELSEIDAKRTIEVQRQDAAQQVGLRTAEKEKQVGIANEQSKQEVQAQAKTTAERNMDVLLVEKTKTAEITKGVAVIQAQQEKDVSVISAEASKQVQIVTAEADRSAAVTRAEGVRDAAVMNAQAIEAEGNARATAEQAMLMAPINTQISLAKEIGTNEGYQEYLITIRKVEIAGDVGKAMAGAMEKADMKVIANSGDIQGGIAKLGDLFTPAGGTSLAGMMEALSMTDTGKAILSKLTGGADPKTPEAGTTPHRTLPRKLQS